MSDVLKGMTREQARVFVALCESQMNKDCNEGMCGAGDVRGMEAVLALAALGAEVLGAKEGWVRTTGDVLDSGGSVALRWRPLTTMNSVVVVRRVLVLPESE